MHLQKLRLHCGLEPFLSLTWRLCELDTAWEREWTSLPHSLHSPSPLPSSRLFFYLSPSVSGAREAEFLPIGACVQSRALLTQQEFAGTTSTDFHRWPLWPLPSSLAALPPFPVLASGSALIIFLWASNHNSCLDRCSGDENVRGEKLKWGRERRAQVKAVGRKIITTTKYGFPILERFNSVVLSVVLLID